MFAFKQFVVRQGGAAMKVGTDGVLIGAWSRIPDNCRRILDIGAGTGLIALMAAQRSDSALITAVESDASSAAQARENAEASKWSDRIEIVHSRIQDYAPEYGFDLILSNPPFYDGTLTCGDTGRTMARHTVSLSFAELVSSAERLLADGGRFSVIVPAESAGRLVAESSMHLVRRCDVRTKPLAAPKRTMLEFSPLFTGAVRFEELTIGDGAGGYSEEYRALTADFDLKM